MSIHFHIFTRCGGVFLVTLCGVIGCAPRQATVAHPGDPTVAGALYATESNVGARAKTLRAIAAARQIVLDDLRHADVPGYKRRIATVEPTGHEPRVTLDMAQGKPKSTSRVLDVAIQGEGLFVVGWPGGANGVAYTRRGTLFSNSQGQLVVELPGSDNHCPLLPAVHLPADTSDLTITESGIVTVLRPGEAAPQQIGTMELSQFEHPDGLKLVREGGLYVATSESGEARPCRPGEAGAGKLLQGFVEQSNVDPAVEQLRLDFLKRWEAALLSPEQ